MSEDLQNLVKACQLNPGNAELESALLRNLKRQANQDFLAHTIFVRDCLNSIYRFTDMICYRDFLNSLDFESEHPPEIDYQSLSPEEFSQIAWEHLNTKQLTSETATIELQSILEECFGHIQEPRNQRNMSSDAVDTLMNMLIPVIFQLQKHSIDCLIYGRESISVQTSQDDRGHWVSSSPELTLFRLAKTMASVSNRFFGIPSCYEYKSNLIEIRDSIDDYSEFNSEFDFDEFEIFQLLKDLKVELPEILTRHNSDSYDASREQSARIETLRPAMANDIIHYCQKGDNANAGERLIETALDRFLPGWEVIDVSYRHDYPRYTSKLIFANNRTFFYEMIFDG